MHYIHLADYLKQGFNLGEVGLLGSHADGSKLVLHSLQIFVLVDHKETIESWSLKEDHLAFLQILVVLL